VNQVLSQLHKFRSLRLSLFVCLSALVLILQVAFALYAYFSLSHEENVKLNRTADQLVRDLVLSVKPLFFELDTESIRNLISVKFEIDRSLVGVTLFDNIRGGKLYTGAIRPTGQAIRIISEDTHPQLTDDTILSLWPSLIGMEDTSNFFVRQAEVWHGADLIGTILCVYTREYIQRTVLDSLRIRALLTFIQLTCLALFMHLIVGALITRPLQRLSEGLVYVQKGMLSHNIPESARTDEIGLIEIAFNSSIANSRQIVRQAQSLASGNYSEVIIPRSSEDELSLALIQMTRDLKNMNSRLEELVAERTISLENEIERRKNVEASLLASQRNLARTLNSIPDAIISTDKAGRISGINTTAEHLANSPKELVKGRLINQVFPFLEVETNLPATDLVSQIFQPSAPNQRILEKHYCMDMRGNRHFFSFSGAPIHDTDDKTIGAVLDFRDITKQRRLEQQLTQVQKMDSMGQMAGGIAHDFNNILAAIIGYGEILEMNTPESDSRHADIEALLLTSRRAADVCRRLLNFSRRSELRKARFSVRECLEDVRLMLKATISARVELAVESGGADLFVVGDPTQIQNAIINLVVNAKDAMPKGGKISLGVSKQTLLSDLTTSTGMIIPAGDYAVAEVHDTGTGIASEHLAQIFEPFFTTKEEGKGTGLGLATVFNIMSEHNGYIHLETELGRGSCFKLYFPLAT